MIRVRACAGRGELRRFETLPEVLHGDHPSFTPPVPGSTMALFRHDHPVQRHVRMTPYLAWRDGRPVGRIAAIVNETHNRTHHDAVGFFGFFDFQRDPRVGDALLARVRQDLAEAGRDTLRGPYGPTANHECGLLVDGADGRPAFLMPWNPPWYEEIYDALGLQSVRDLHTYDLVEPDHYRALFGPLAERARSRGFSVRSVRADQVESEAERILHLFNEGLSDEWGFVPMTRPELDRSLRELRPILDEDLIFLLERNGETLGFALGFPDLNEWLHELRSTPRWLRLPRLLWWTRRRALRRVRFALVAVLPPARRVGGIWLIVDEVVRRPLGTYPKGTEISWIQDVNRDMQRIAREAGVPRTRTHRIYETSLEPRGDAASGGDAVRG